MEQQEKWVERTVRRIVTEEFIMSTLVFAGLVYMFNLIGQGVNYYVVIGFIVVLFYAYYRLTMRKGKYKYMQKGRESVYTHEKGETEVKTVKIAPRGLIPIKREAFNQGVGIVVAMEVFYLIGGYAIRNIYMRVVYTLIIFLILGFVSIKRGKKYKKRVYHMLAFNNQGRKVWLTEEESKGIKKKESIEDVKEEVSKEKGKVEKTILKEKEEEVIEEKVVEEAIEGEKEEVKEVESKEEIVKEEVEEVEEEVEEVSVIDQKVKNVIEEEYLNKVFHYKKVKVGELEESEEDNKEEVEESKESESQDDTEDLEDSEELESQDDFQELIDMVEVAKIDRLGEEKVKEEVEGGVGVVNNEGFVWGNGLSVQGTNKSVINGEMYGKLPPELAKELVKEKERKEELKSKYEKIKEGE